MPGSAASAFSNAPSARSAGVGPSGVPASSNSSVPSSTDACADRPPVRALRDVGECRLGRRAHALPLLAAAEVGAAGLRGDGARCARRASRSSARSTRRSATPASGASTVQATRSPARKRASSSLRRSSQAPGRVGEQAGDDGERGERCGGEERAGSHAVRHRSRAPQASAAASAAVAASEASASGHGNGASPEPSRRSEGSRANRSSSGSAEQAPEEALVLGRRVQRDHRQRRPGVLDLRHRPSQPGQVDRVVVEVADEQDRRPLRDRHGRSRRGRGRAPSRSASRRRTCPATGSPGTPGRSRAGPGAAARSSARSGGAPPRACRAAAPRTRSWRRRRARSGPRRPRARRACSRSARMCRTRCWPRGRGR